MVRRRRLLPLGWAEVPLERRELLSRAGLPISAAVINQQSAGNRPPFHHDGINGLVLQRSFVNKLNDRLAASASQAGRVTSAFKVFASNFAKLPVTPDAAATGPTLASLISTLTTQVDFALATNPIRTSRPTPSQRDSPHVAPLANVALIPFANGQIDQLQLTLAATPPVVGADGTAKQPDPTPAINVAVNAILNALAETTVHPTLFLSPSDFYLNPDVQFTINSSGAPASAPGFLYRGPGGVILPGTPPQLLNKF